MRELTKAEEQVMQILWKIEKGFVNDILDHFKEPKPAYNTISTIVRILEKKGFIGYEAFGKTHQYFPLVSKEEYTQTFLQRFINNYFGSSYKELVSFFAKKENLSLEELEEIKKIMSEHIRRKK